MQISIKAKNGQAMPVKAKHIFVNDTKRLTIISETDLRIFVDFTSESECAKQYQKCLRTRFRKCVLIAEDFGFLLNI